MTDQKLKAELEALRQQVEDISKKVGEGGPEEGSSSADAGQSTPLDEARRVAQQLGAPQLAEQAAAYLKTLSQDVHDSKPRALITAFLAGFIAGRVTGR